jgi:hypothetical protein
MCWKRCSCCGKEYEEDAQEKLEVASAITVGPQGATLDTVTLC